MASYHFTVSPISRGKGDSITCSVSYITGRNLIDDYCGKTYYHARQDDLYQQIILPEYAPEGFHDLQSLCRAIDAAEKRYDARTGREYIGSLPNELPLDEQIHIVTEFAESCFLEKSLCAIIAIHEGRNDADPSQNNPHSHMIIPTRTLTPNGFSSVKCRELDRKSLLLDWRKKMG